MEDDFKLGVVIPYYRTGRLREVLMKELVQLLKAQMIENDHFKVCIVEDGTYTESIEDESYCELPLWYFRLKENHGISYARNRGIEYLLNEEGCNYIVMIDSDDYIDYDYFNKLYEAWIKEKRLYYFTDFEILDKIKAREGLKERVTGIVLHKSLLENARFNEATRYAEDVEFNDNYLRDKLTEPYYIDTIYHYNFGIDKKCLSYQAQIERGDGLND